MEAIKFKYKDINPTRTAELYVDDIEKIYIGKGNNCRCGCGGDYIYDRNEIADIVENFSRLAKDGRKVLRYDELIFEINTSDTGRKDLVTTIYLKK